MTNIERFQRLQVELVRTGFETELHAKPNGSNATISLYVDLRKQTAEGIEKLEALTTGQGFSYLVGENSLAAITLAG